MVSLVLGRGTQVVRERSAKPLCVGSIPTRASISLLLHDCCMLAGRMAFPLDTVTSGACIDCAPTHAKAPRPLIVAIFLFAGLNLAIFVLRAVSVVRYGSLFGTTGGECLMIYSIWKKMHGHPVYEWPLRWPFSLSLYNYWFYYAYAEVFRLLGWWDAQILTLGRLLTAAFAAVGALAQWKLAQVKIASRAHKYLCLALCFGLWFSTSVIRWWALTIRPDVPAIALATIALLCIGRIRGEKGVALAAVFFYLAWTFKQSVALIAVTSILYLLITRRRSGWLLLAVFGGAIAATAWLGTQAYRYSVFVAPRIVPAFTFSHAYSAREHPLVTNGMFLLPMLAFIARPMRRVFGVSDCR